jgi:hypothetical protein
MSWVKQQVKVRERPGERLMGLVIQGRPIYEWINTETGGVRERKPRPGKGAGG